jgi:hypothetical protein
MKRRASLVAAHESVPGTCATCHDEAFRSALKAKADLQRRLPLVSDSDPKRPFESIHSTRLSALVTDWAMKRGIIFPLHE